MTTVVSADALKPRSMPVGQRNVLRSNDSASLWNCTLSPGWTLEEVQILRKALMRFGIGNWAKIIDSQCLIGKTIAQMNLQAQRMLGQQSTAEFAGLHIDPFVIGELNSKKQGADIKRKNNCIVNTGAKLTREEIRRKLQENKDQYELPEEEWASIELPKPDDPLALIEAKRAELRELREELSSIAQQIAAMKQSAEPSETADLQAEESSEATSTSIKRPREDDE
ncbi:hypothetical protein H4R33_001277 [Dimargaris cristalligena]|uniref:Myb-like domain-containing protein n=1 Tax=Dimargaris cristalligena TaxID=215637 RepID=A0A4P9ZV06_9FUNG|nr:hypothetical protein H4R33_001277 [Dimargaris cristalligena]RKP37397.1 hypothetical protein BJ085DRAFT_39811 [Dimargaris cristalligena]|eukprot:RKP37397.1 hypothetical protein BJ085DRAFT_39811 [Dimargaris cristalligena]